MRHLLLFWLGVCLTSTAWAGTPSRPLPLPEAGIPDPARLVLPVSALTVVEGSTASFSVALSRDPFVPVTVTVERTDGDEDLTVREGASLTFDSATWSTPQQVVLAAAKDADSEDGTATFTLSAPYLESRTVIATEADQDPLAPVFTTVPVTQAVVAAPYRLVVHAKGRPAPTYALRTAPPGMSLDALGHLTWTPSQTGEVDVAVVASNGQQPDAELAFRLVVGRDQPPVARITAPFEGARVPAGWADYSCGCADDVGCVSAEFWVDGQRLQTQEGPGPSYSFGGAPGRWDTTGLAPGEHLLYVLVTDTLGQQASSVIMVCVACPEPDAGTATDGGTLPRGDDEGDDVVACGCGAGALAPAVWTALGLLGLRARRRRS
ncbi:putative Ig domain-containing protein [Corallococcus silvisoli]|uniref:putative Ig domain-containing protein n=1 Tax=Corallococcus silvisoli TaxID=2697031 RepID=UPI00137765A8|nr:putative Ig domain-containing protein [Corallococcus silvisoli]NBD07424.1 hypothetical protein [Corallococcus silvisoli]